MKHKHFTFDLDYFPITNSNIFQSIKIQHKNNSVNANKLGIKRFPLKNQLNLQEIPDIMYFEKSTKKPKIECLLQSICPSSNQTKKSHNRSYDEIEWSIGRNSNTSKRDQRRVESCPKPSKLAQCKPIKSVLKNQNKYTNISDKQKQEARNKKLNELKYFQNDQQKKSQLQSLQECQSQFDESSQSSLAVPKALKKENSLKSSENDKDSKKTKCTNSNKHNKSKKTEKSYTSKNIHNNPQSLSTKQRQRQKKFRTTQEKEELKIGNSLLAEDITKSKKKFISLNRKSYYLIGSKNNKNRSLNKQKKVKSKSLRQDANVILTNGDLIEYSSSAPSNYRNTSLTSTVNSKVKAGNCKNLSDRKKQMFKSESQAQTQIQLFEIVKKTGQILGKYQGQCIQLKKQKQQYQEKYEQAIKKLNRIRDEIEFVMKTQ